MSPLFPPGDYRCTCAEAERDMVAYGAHRCIMVPGKPSRRLDPFDWYAKPPEEEPKP